MAQRTNVEFSDFERIHERMERAWRMVGGPANPSFRARYFEPPADVYQTANEVVVLLEVAGIPNQEIEIHVDGRNMIIHGQRQPLPGPADREYSQMEIVDGRFQRALLLPAPVDPGSSEATYKDGILKIVLPKAAGAGGTQLRIVCH